MDGWCFAIVNNKLAEIYFEKDKEGVEIWAHCYVKEEEYKTKKEQTYIKEDTSKFKFAFRLGKYRLLNKPS